jgi:peptide/nickel transport system substrate-binding protein
MTKLGLRGALLALGVMAVVFVVACGSDDDGGGGGKEGGEIRIGSVLPDEYDPVMFQTVQANQPLQLVYKGLVTYKDAEGSEGNELIPGLAEEVPKPTNGGKTYKFQLRKGLKYSDGSPVKASDFENTIKRLLYLGGPFSSFATTIEGAVDYQEKKQKDADIPGIESNDQTGEITVNLEAPDSQFLYSIGLANSAPTPAAKSPFKKSNTIPGAGPYKIQIVNPTREFILTKNRNFNIPGIAEGKVDKITVVKSSVTKMTQDVINGRLDFMTEDPTGDQLAQVQAKYKDRFRLDPNPANTYWFFMNHTTPPFDKKEVRQAVNYAIDERALKRVFGGRLQPTCNFLPPQYEGMGYEEITDCPWGDPNEPPQLDKARDLIKKAGVDGDSVTVWGNNKDPRPAITDYLRDTLNQIGLKAKSKIIDQQVYFGTVGTKKTKAQIGFTDWYQDFPHPNDFFEPNLSEAALASSPVFNFAYAPTPAGVDAEIKKLKPQPPEEVADQWAALDRRLVESGDIAIYGNELASTFMSERMDFENCSGVHPVYKNDWALFCLKE